MCRERWELELRKEGQLTELLGEALAGESSAALQRLAREDQRQAKEGLVALTSHGKRYYKLLEELTEADMAARSAVATGSQAACYRLLVMGILAVAPEKGKPAARWGRKATGHF
jgi:hypothetical protein